MKSILTWVVFLGCTLSTFSQLNSFENRLKLDTINREEMQRWEFDTASISCLSDGLWEHILPKSTLENIKIIIGRNELNYFLEKEGVKVKTETDPVSNPEHWESRFGQQIQTITLNKPLTILAIKNDKLVQYSLDSLKGIRYHTFYPNGEFDVPNQNMVPIVYQQDNQFDEYSPVLLVTSNFMGRVGLEEVKIHRDTQSFGTVEFPGTLHRIGIDFNDDGQDEVVMYRETMTDDVVSEGDEGLFYERSIIALYFMNNWYRTSYWREGPDGLEGF